MITSSRDVAPTNEWNNETVTVSYVASDALSGVDTDASDLGDDVFSTEGEDQSATGTVVDLAGNTATDTISGINIDKTAPTITATRSGVANANNWDKSDVTVSYDCDDTLSLIDTCSASDILGEGEAQSATGTAVDLAGNTATDTISGINIDKTLPVVTIETPPFEVAYYLLGELVDADWTAEDALSGIFDVVASADDEAPIDTSEARDFTFTVTATDLAGNVKEVSHEYVVERPEAIIERIINTVMGPRGIKVALQAKLNAADASIARAKKNSEKTAINNLNASINFVETRRGKQLSNELATRLILATREIIAIYQAIIDGS